MDMVFDLAVVLGDVVYLGLLCVFGGFALVLLRRTGSIRRAARTIVVLYPIAFLWDWYSLRIGIFDVNRHVDVFVLGVPIEEHLFILVVSAFVIGVHEQLRVGAEGSNRSA